MSVEGIRGGQARRVSQKAAQVEKVDLSQAQAAQAEDVQAQTAGGVSEKGFDKVASQAYQQLGAMADKFKMLSGAPNPFSSFVQRATDAVLDAQKEVTQAIDDWGKFMREIAEKDKKASLEANQFKTFHLDPADQKREQLAQDQISRSIGNTQSE